MVTQALPLGEAFHIMKFRLDGRLCHRQHNNHTTVDATLHHCENTPAGAKEALLPGPCRRSQEAGEAIDSNVEGFHLHEQLCAEGRRRVTAKL